MAVDDDPRESLDRLYLEIGRALASRKGDLGRKEIDRFRRLTEKHTKHENAGVRIRTSAIVEFLDELKEVCHKKITWTVVERALLVAILIYLGAKILAWSFFPRVAGFF